MTLDEANKLLTEDPLPRLNELIEHGTPTEQFLAAIVRSIVFEIETLKSNDDYDSYWEHHDSE